MSTYSWSYKTAIHRHVPSKLDKTDPSGPNKSDVYQIENGKVSEGSSSENNGVVSSGKPKRLNWRAKIYVGNLNKKTNEASLAYYFSVFGDIEDIKLIRDHGTKESRGFAFITFEKIESAEKAKKWCSFNYPTLDDNSITVASAERKSHKMKISKNEQRSKRDPSQTLFWEFRWTNMDDAQVYGPYETSLMQAWQNQGYFNRGCWVRQVHRQVNSAGGKSDVKASTSQVVHVKDDQHFKASISEEIRLEDEEGIKADTLVITCAKGSEESANEESYEAGPAKKPRLVIEYSDSDDDDEEDVSGDVEVVRGRSANCLLQEEEAVLKLTENQTQNDSSLNKEHSQLDETESKYSVKENERTSLENKIEHSTLPEDDEQEGFDARKVDLKSNEKATGRVKKQQEELSKDLRLINNEKNKIDVNETRSDKEESINEESFGDEEFTANMSENILEQEEHSVQTQVENEQKQNINTIDNSRASDDDNGCQVSKKTEESLGILEMYEQGSTVLSDEQNEGRINDEDLRLSDYSSSEEEDLEDDDQDDISTEFVAISEIDFNLYP